MKSLQMKRTTTVMTSHAIHYLVLIFCEILLKTEYCTAEPIARGTHQTSPLHQCTFPAHWSGRWFQSGVQTLLEINSTHISQKGACVATEPSGKWLLHDASEDCYRCLVLDEKHATVVQYKESYCMHRGGLDEICGTMVGDSPLYSMFRVSPRAPPEPCPFSHHSGAPQFRLTYNKGSGECASVPSRADSCTDDSRLLLKYQACPDVPATESNVEELVCLASFKEGSIRYLVGKITQVNRRIDTASHEESYRCFVYKKSHHEGKLIYEIAQSADATCNGLSSMQNIIEGSKTMRLTSVDNQHNRCRFPSWITEHHKWFSLDHKRVYHFSHKNATLKISDELSKPSSQPQSIVPLGLTSNDEHHSQTQNPKSIEMRLVCHSILQAVDNKKVQIVAHITEGCNSGHICMTFSRRDSGVMELQQTEKLVDNSDDACHNFDSQRVPHITLLSSGLQPRPCPHPGRYHVTSLDPPSNERRKKRQKSGTEDSDKTTSPVECTSRDFESLDLGCSTNNGFTFRSACSSTGYTCHGSWQESGVNYLIAAPISRKSNDARRLCFVYTHTGLNDNETHSSTGSRRTGSSSTLTHLSNVRPTMQLSILTETCHRHIEPGLTARALNLTSNGTCAESSGYMNSAQSIRVPSRHLSVMLLMLLSTCVTSLSTVQIR